MISSLYKDRNSNSFNDQKSVIVIKIAKGEKSKSVGEVNLNLAKYIEN